MIRLLVVEDHPVAIAGIKHMFRPSRDGIEIAGSAMDADGAVGTFSGEDFDLIILDLWLKSGDPLANVRKISAGFPGKPIIIYTSEDSFMWLRKMVAEGVSAYVVKTTGRAELRSAIERVSAGENLLAGRFSEINTGKIRFTDPGADFSLTPKQLEIVGLLSQGNKISKISKQTETSKSNVEKILKHLRNLFDAKNNIELVIKINRRGELP